VNGESFSGLARALKSACEEGDWERLKSLDERVRKNIEQAVTATTSEKEHEQLIAFLKRLQRIYQLVVEGSEKHRNEIATELKKLTRDQKAVNSYLDSSLL